MNIKIRRFVSHLPLYVALMGLAACEGNEMFEKEQYKKVVYVLSNNDFVYGFDHSLNTETSTGFVSINVGGTTSVESDITVTLERDPAVLDQYNHANFDLDESKYAKELDPSRYTIKSYTAVLKAGSSDPYVRLPIEVRPHGLSPDSTYLIPLKIVANDSFEMNPDKSKVLYRVFLANDFTTQANPTVVFMKGKKNTLGAKATIMSANKTLYPLGKRTIRVNAALENSSQQKNELVINQSSLIMEVMEEKLPTTDGQFEYNPITLRPFNSKYIQVETLAGTDELDNPLSIKEANRYVVESEKVTRYFLSYRYRTLKKAATDTTEAEWNDWIYATENLRDSK